MQIYINFNNFVANSACYSRALKAAGNLNIGNILISLLYSSTIIWVIFHLYINEARHRFNIIVRTLERKESMTVVCKLTQINCSQSRRNECLGLHKLQTIQDHNYDRAEIRTCDLPGAGHGQQLLLCTTVLT